MDSDIYNVWLILFKKKDFDDGSDGSDPKNKN